MTDDAHDKDARYTSSELTYKILYEFERRLDDKFKEARNQNREDTENAVARALVPIHGGLLTINSRMKNGEDKFKEQGERMDDHSKRIDRKKDEDDTREIRRKEDDKKSSGGWISVDKIPTILVALGTLISTVMASVALMRTPSQPDQQASINSHSIPAASGKP